MSFRNLLSSIALAGLMAGGAMAQPTTTPTARTSSFPLIGLGSTETAQVNVANLAVATTTGTTPSCTGSISFLNSSGATIGTATPFTLASGQIASASLPFSKSGGTSVHTVVRAVVTQTVAAGVPCQLESMVEVYDTTTGVTHSSSGGGIGIGGGGPLAGRN